MNAGSAKQKRSPLLRFSIFYLIAGIAAISACYFLVNPALCLRLAISWLAIAIPLAMIVWGRARREASDLAAFVYLTGLALLPMLFILGILLALNSAPVMQKLRLLL